MTSGEWGDCTGSGSPSPEVCDGLDNDCNGQNDEGNPGGGIACNTGKLGVCAAGTTACQNGSIVCNQNVQPGTEVCDGVDNDCDGQVDEGCNSCWDNPVLLTLDRSESMAYKPDGTPISNPANWSKSKGSVLVNAVSSIANSYPTIKFGVELFPHGDGTCQTLTTILNTYDAVLGDYHLNTTSHCGMVPDTPLLPLSTSYLPSVITSSIVTISTPLCYGTPTDLALMQAQATLAGFTQTPRYVILVTDGKQGCGETSATVWNIIQSMKSANIYTVVLGFDGSGALNTGTAKQHLSDWACGGGKPLNDGCCDSTGHYNTALCGTGNYTFYFSSAPDGSDLQTVIQSLLTNVCP